MIGAGEAKALAGGDVTVLDGGAANPLALGRGEMTLLVLGAGERELKPTRSLRLVP